MDLDYEPVKTSKAARGKVTGGQSSDGKVKKHCLKKVTGGQSSDGKVKKRGAKSVKTDDDDILLKDLIQQSKKDRPESSRVKGGSLRLGSDCAGVGSEFLALKMIIGDRVKLRTVFVSEINPEKRKALLALHERYDDKIIYEDMAERDVEKAPSCDIYCAGPPCPSFSCAGKGAGLSDARGRVLLSCVEYILCKRPALSVIENVQGLTTGKHRKILDGITTALKNAGYRVKAEILNCQAHGLPQNRPRVYIVATLTSAVGPKFKFPEPMTLPANYLERFLVHDVEQHTKVSKVAAKNIEKLQQQLSGPSGSNIVLDAHSGRDKLNFMYDVSPCLTKARSGSHGHYLMKHARFMNIFEIGALQGWPKSIVQFMQLHASDRCLGTSFGDGMSISVLCRLLPNALLASGVVRKKCLNPVWDHIPECGQMPGAVYSKTRL
ncbi:unnamed protein product [Symbiodinium sp. CCMP2592]|nr:unnamed protein product [Symbiodinium sp. CCMP2592]